MRQGEDFGGNLEKKGSEVTAALLFLLSIFTETLVKEPYQISWCEYKIRCLVLIKIQMDDTRNVGVGPGQLHLVTGDHARQMHWTKGSGFAQSALPVEVLQTNNGNPMLVTFYVSNVRYPSWTQTTFGHKTEVFKVDLDAASQDTGLKR
ncbi:hypothetical protein CBL_12682 [Carabus blaptoides fortunei]